MRSRKRIIMDFHNYLSMSISPSWKTWTPAKEAGVVTDCHSTLAYQVTSVWGRAAPHTAPKREPHLFTPLLSHISLCLPCWQAGRQEEAAFLHQTDPFSTWVTRQQVNSSDLGWPSTDWDYGSMQGLLRNTAPSPQIGYCG